MLCSSAFGHLDSPNASIRTGGQIFQVSEANIRFERVSEVVQKSSGVVEEVGVSGSTNNLYYFNIKSLYQYKTVDVIHILSSYLGNASKVMI